MLKKMLLALVSCIPFVGANAVADEYVGTIAYVVCHANDVSPVCSVAVNGAKPVLACAGSDWRYTFDGSNTEGKNLLAILLAAQVTRATVHIGGKGTCLLAPNSEDLRHVYIATT